MNFNISAWCIRNPIPPIVLFLLLTIAGVTALSSLGVESQPNVDMPIVYVYAGQQGASPTEMETQVTNKIESAVASVAGVKHVNSTINLGSSQTEITFELGTDIDRATNDVRQEVAGIAGDLPRGMPEPTVSRQDSVVDGRMTYTVSSDKRSPAEICELIETTIKNTLEAMPCIGKVERFGGVRRQIHVDLDPIRLEAFGATVEMVNSQLRALNVNLPAGKVYLSGSEESIRTLGTAASVETLRKTRISLPGKRWVELGALGEVLDTTAERTQFFIVNDKPAIGMDLSRRRGKNIVDMEKDVEKGTAILEKKYPDLKFVPLYSPAKYVKESCSATFEAMILGALLAVLVLFVFLRNWRAALIAALAMPLSVIPTFSFLQCAGYTLNDMSLLGLALVIGILVDDAIVEIENIVRHMNLGKSPYQASIDAADEIGLAVVATTMAAIAVFLPVAFMGGLSGLYFRQFGWTVSVAVFCSLLVARLITPLMAAYWLKAQKQHSNESIFAPLYDKVLKQALKHRFLTVLFGAVIFGASVALFQALPTSLFSQVDSGYSRITIELPPGSPLEDTLAVVERISRLVNKRPETKKTFAVVGSGMLSNQGWVSITLKERNERKLSTSEFENELRPQIGAPGVKVSFGGGWGSGRVQILLTSADSGTLEKSAQALLSEIRQIPELHDVKSNAQMASPEIIIQPDLDRAAEQGISVEAIARTAMVATMGDSNANSPKFDLSDRQIPIDVRLAPQYLRRESVINNLKIANSDGALIPLGSVAKVRMDTGISKIVRYDQSRQIEISAKFGEKFSLSQALDKIHSLPAFKNLPPIVSDHPSGDVEEQKDLFGGFGYAIFTGVALIYAVLVLLFRGFFQPLTIMMSLPLSLGGALVGLWVLSKPLDMYGLIGIVMLMGLVTKNAILLVEYCLVQMENGKSRGQAIFEAGRTRMRPILMTTTAMIAGMMPIAVGFGAGAEARAPMAIAVIGGLFASTILTLVVVPVVFTYMDDFQKWIFGSKKTPHEPAVEKHEASPTKISH